MAVRMNRPIRVHAVYLHTDSGMVVSGDREAFVDKQNRGTLMPVQDARSALNLDCVALENYSDGSALRTRMCLLASSVAGLRLALAIGIASQTALVRVCRVSYADSPLHLLCLPCIPLGRIPLRLLFLAPRCLVHLLRLINLVCQSVSVGSSPMLAVGALAIYTCWAAQPAMSAPETYSPYI